MFKNCLCGVNTSHANGFSFKIKSLPYWLLMCFSTPFYYRAANIYGEGKPGDCILHPPGISIEHGALSKDTSFKNDWIYFSAATEDMQALQLPLNQCVPSSISMFNAALQNILQEEIQSDNYSNQLISNQINNMLIQFKRASIQTDVLSVLQPTKLNEARLNILNNLQMHWTLESMASLTGYSVSHFCKLYTAIYHISPINELIEHRLEKAKLLLKLQSYTITEIAELCGFSSIHYFSNAFKKRTGFSPSEYK